MSTLGPQWLCDCNISGNAKNLATALKGAGQHFIIHAEEENYREGSLSVTVYRKRNDWACTVATLEQAEKAAYPLRTVATLTADFSPMAAAMQKLSASAGLTLDSMDALMDAVEGTASGAVSYASPLPPVSFQTYVTGASAPPLLGSSTKAFAEAQKAMLEYFEANMNLAPVTYIRGEERRAA